MPFKAFGLACIVVTIGSANAYAQHVDFSKLLNSLTYSDQEAQDVAAGESPAASSPEAPVPKAALAPPTLDRGPSAAPHSIPRLPGARLSEYGEIGPGVDAPIFSDDAILSDDELGADDALVSDEVSVIDDAKGAEAVDSSPGTDAETDPAAGGTRVDFDRMFAGNRAAAALPDPQPSAESLVASPAPLHGAHGVQDISSGANGETCGCQTCRASLPGTACLDHPNLPPPTSLEAYYRTPACYRDLWSGFEQERQRECHRSHKHIHHAH